jgi:hypothetical protein
MFARHGVPTIVQTDNGPPFNGDLFNKMRNKHWFQSQKSYPALASSQWRSGKNNEHTWKSDNNQSSGKEKHQTTTLQNSQAPQSYITLHHWHVTCRNVVWKECMNRNSCHSSSEENTMRFKEVVKRDGEMKEKMKKHADDIYNAVESSLTLHD